MALCICQQQDKQYLCVSALLETFLLWEFDCTCPPTQAAARGKCVALNSAAIPAARASAAAYRPNMEARRQLPARLVSLWQDKDMGLQSQAVFSVGEPGPLCE